MDQIKLGKVKDASELLESYFSMLHDNPYLQLDRAREIGAQLTDTIHSAIIGKEKELDDRYSDIKQLKAEIHSLESVHDVADCVVSYAQAAARVMYDQLQNKRISAYRKFWSGSATTTIRISRWMMSLSRWA